MSNSVSIYLRRVSDKLYVTHDGSVGVVWTVDGWQIINAQTGEALEPGGFHQGPVHASGAILRRLREAFGDGG